MTAWFRSFLTFAATGLAATILGSPASAEMGDWVEGDVVDVRLVATARDGEAPVAVVEMRLDPGWKSYWRTPGEGGLPPTFDFTISGNAVAAEIGYPAPHRYNDGYTVSNVYEGRVIFPIELTGMSLAAPIALDLSLGLGVCETICIPMTIETSVTLVPDEIDAVALALFEEGTALLPAPPSPGEFEIVDFALIAKDGAESFFEATAIVPQGFGTELFVEGPEDWWGTAPQQTAREGNRLTFAFGFERPDADRPLSGTVFTFTLVSAGHAIEQTITLP